MTTVIIVLTLFTIITRGYARAIFALMTGLAISLLGIAFYVFVLYVMVNYR